MLALALLLTTSSALDEGIALYQALEFEKATIALQRLVLDPDLPPRERALANVWLGLTYTQLGDVNAAREACARAVVDDRDVIPPPDAPPNFVAILEEERKKVPVVDEAPPPPPPPSANEEPTNWAGITSGVAAGLLVVAAIGVGAFGLQQLSVANDITVKAQPALDAYDTAVVAGWTSAGLGGAALVAAGVSAALFLSSE